MLYFNTVLQNFLLCTSEVLLSQTKFLPILFIPPNSQLHIAARLFTNSMCLVKKKKKVAENILITLGNFFFGQPTYFPTAFFVPPFLSIFSCNFK